MDVAINSVGVTIVDLVDSSVIKISSDVSTVDTKDVVVDLSSPSVVKITFSVVVRESVIDKEVTSGLMIVFVVISFVVKPAVAGEVTVDDSIVVVVLPVEAEVTVDKGFLVGSVVVFDVVVSRISPVASVVVLLTIDVVDASGLTVC